MKNNTKPQGIVLFPLTALTLSGAAVADHPSLGLGSQISGPIVGLSAMPLPKGRWFAGLRLEHTESDPFSEAELQTLALSNDEVHSAESVQVAFIAFGYGLTDNFTLSASLPYISRNDIVDAHLHEEGPPPEVEVEELGDAQGIGDLTVLGQYRFLRREAAGLEAAWFAGMQVPTGETDEEDQSGVRFEAEFQPGSGSWDPMLGIAMTKSWGRASLSISLLYTFANEGTQDTDLGDVLNYDVALVYRLSDDDAEHEHGHSHQSHGHVSWDLLLELNGEWRDELEREGISDSNSGGNTIYLTPGVRVSTEGGWSGFLSLGFPIEQDLNGAQHDADYRLSFGLAKGF